MSPTPKVLEVAYSCSIGYMKSHTVRVACIATYSTAEPTVSAGAPAVGAAVHYGAVSLFIRNRRVAARRLRRIVD